MSYEQLTLKVNEPSYNYSLPSDADTVSGTYVKWEYVFGALMY